VAQRGVFRRVLIGVAVVLFSLAGREAAAQLPCNEFLCGLGLDCGDGNFIQCTVGGCTCRISCNANRDCRGDQFCRLGVCASLQPERCTENSQCPSGQVCNAASGTCLDPCNNSGDCTLAGQMCAGDGTCRDCANDGQCGGPGRRCAGGRCETIPPTPTPVPQCRSDRDCDDRNPCNGRETCDGFNCQRGVRPCERPEPPSTVQCVRDNPDGCFHCEYDIVVLRDPIVDGELAIIDEPINVRPIPTPRPGRGGLPPIGGGGGFRARGSFQARFASAPPNDLPSSRIRIALADEKGNPLVDYTTEPGAWSDKNRYGWKSDAKGATYRDERTGSLVKRLTLAPAADAGRQTFELEGAVDPKSKGLGAAQKPRLALHVQWKDVSGILAVARFAACEASSARGEKLRCKSEASK
jgi:Cys-rich repeat protein